MKNIRAYLVVTVTALLAIVDAQAQSPTDYSALVGTFRQPQSGNPQSGLRVTFSQNTFNGELINLGPVVYTTNTAGKLFTSSGDTIRFRRLSTIYVEANVAGYNVPGGVQIQIPNSPTFDLADLQPPTPFVGSAFNIFSKIKTITGTYPVADAEDDSLTLVSTDNSVGIAGTASTDRIDFTIPALSITDAKISASAAIALSKLAPGASSGQMIVTDGSNIPVYRTPAGDVTVTALGVFSVADNSHNHDGTTISGLDASLDLGSGFVSTLRGGLGQSISSLNNGRLIISSGNAIGERDALAPNALVVGSSTLGVTALPLSTANYIVGMNAAASANEYKQFLGTTNQINLAHAPNSLTFSLPQSIATTSLVQFARVLADTVRFSNNGGFIANDDTLYFFDNSGVFAFKLAIDNPTSGFVLKAGAGRVVSFQADATGGGGGGSGTAFRVRDDASVVSSALQSIDFRAGLQAVAAGSDSINVFVIGSDGIKADTDTLRLLLASNSGLIIKAGSGAIDSLLIRINGNTLERTSTGLRVPTNGITTNEITAMTSAEFAGEITNETGTAGALVFSISPTIQTPTISGAITFPSGVRQTFAPDATLPGLNWGSLSSDPSNPANGDVWYRTDTGKFRGRQNGANIDFIGTATASWNSLTAPTGAMSMVSDGLTEIMTFDFQAAFTSGSQYVIKQTTGNPSGGVLFDVQTTDADVTPFRATAQGTTNGVQLGSGGELVAIGAGGIDATSFNGETIIIDADIADSLQVDKFLNVRTSAMPLSNNQLGFFLNDADNTLRAYGRTASGDLVQVTFAAGSGAAALDDLSDVALTSVASAQILVRNVANTNFINATMSGDATMGATGALTVANSAITGAKVLDNTLNASDIDETTAYNFSNTGNVIRALSLRPDTLAFRGAVTVTSVNDTVIFRKASGGVAFKLYVGASPTADQILKANGDKVLVFNSDESGGGGGGSGNFRVRDDGSSLSSAPASIDFRGGLQVTEPAADSLEVKILAGNGLVALTDSIKVLRKATRSGLAFVSDSMFVAALDSSHIAGIVSSDIIDGSILTADLANSAADSNKIKNGHVTTLDIKDGNVNTADLAAQASTYAKIQNISATQRMLGRNSSGAGVIEEVTISEFLDWIGSAAQGDILYRGASSWARLGAGTSGQFLKTNGTGANPAWATVSGGGGSADFDFIYAMMDAGQTTNISNGDHVKWSALAGSSGTSVTLDTSTTYTTTNNAASVGRFTINETANYEIRVALRVNFSVSPTAPFEFRIYDATNGTEKANSTLGSLLSPEGSSSDYTAIYESFYRGTLTSGVKYEIRLTATADLAEIRQASSFLVVTKLSASISATGDITSVVAGDALTGGGTSGDVTLNVNPKLSGVGRLIITSDSLLVHVNSIDSTRAIDGSFINSDIRVSTLDSTRFKQLAISAGDINDAAILNSKYANSSITASKMANGDHGAFTYASNVATLDASSVSGGNAGIITDNTITADDVAADAIGASELLESADFSITGSMQFDSDALHIFDTNASHDLIITPGSDLTADRVLTITTGDAARTLTMTADVSVGGTNTGDVTLAGTPDYITISGQVITRNKLDLVDDLNTFSSANLATNLTDESGAAGVFPRFSLTSAAQGDVIYYNGTNWVNLPPGTSGHFLQTQGAAANPQWAASSGSGDITAVGPGYASGAAFTDGVVSTGTTMLVWEGTTDNTNELNIISPSADPGADIDITLPGATGTLATLAGTETLTNKTYDTQGTGNAFADVIEFDMGPLAWNRQSSTLDSSFVGTNVKRFAFSFDASTDEIIRRTFRLPSYTAGSTTFELVIFWYSAAATSGSAVFGLAEANSAVSANFDPSLSSITYTQTTTDGTAGDINTTTITLSSPGWAAGDLVTLYLRRDADGTGGTDSLVGDAIVIGMTGKISVSK